MTHGFPLTFGDRRGGHIAAYGGQAWGWSAFYVLGEIYEQRCEGRGFTAEAAIANLWSKLEHVK